MTLLAVDSGTRALGYAWFASDGLAGAGLIRASGLVPMVENLEAFAFDERVERIVVELPEYRGRGSAANPDDLISLAASAGAAAAWAIAASREVSLVRPTLTFARPSEWKRSLPKTVCEARILKRLSEAEVRVLNTALASTNESLRHNVVDAVGIGLWACGRFRA